MHVSGQLAGGGEYAVTGGASKKGQRMDRPSYESMTEPQNKDAQIAWAIFWKTQDRDRGREGSRRMRIRPWESRNYL